MTKIHRNFIEIHIQDFRRTDSTTCCAMCSDPLTKIHIDHVIHLAQLIHDFNLVFGERSRDDEYNYYAGWIQYHKQHAQLRKTCPHCNLTRIKWSPSKPVCSTCKIVEKLLPDGACARCDSRCV